MDLSEIVKQLSPSLTLKISAKAKTMKSNGIPVIDFSVGEPDFPTPEHVKEAGIQAIRDNFTGYTQNDGIPDLKDAIIQRLIQDDALSFSPDEILISAGAKMSLYLAMAAALNPGDEVIIPAPYWVSYPEQVRLTGAVPVIVHTEESSEFILLPEQLEAALTSKTRAIIINNPSNPSGAAYETDQLRAILEIAHRNKLLIIADEIYSQITYEGYRFVRSLNIMPETRAHTVLIDGASKAYSMTGWRIGYAAGPATLIGGMKRIQGHTTSNPVSISQKAAVAAFRGDQRHLVVRVREFQERRDFLLASLAQIPGVSVCVPKGAFYLFPNVSKLFGRSAAGHTMKTAMDICDYLLETAHVALVPGEGFGAPNNIRLSFATSMENLREGMTRIQKALTDLV
ncbi:pyridoxal phosphate-dependent aminotransferase [bacterium]|nr:pyridoxal phosphate-dependent aminotransferase [candidate division CSSED10-310 bacterium]